MSKTMVSHVSLTVSTVKVFIETMKLINEYNLWDDIQAYLKKNGKSDMFVDYDVFFFVREMIERDGRFDPENRLFKILLDHDDPHRSSAKPSS